ncbi:podoplanin [Perognathus longimembris pacificus]|uniref:podoplanin n=1 Tax=Perognathus longimembris pacificus TaxID=214514 RepID=UPI00201915A4|nr:podoplanin [Perognathus longimembris pacificus]
MWRKPVLLWILGSAWLCVPAKGAVVGLLEDDIVTPGAEGSVLTLGAEDNEVTTAPTEGPQLLTRAQSTTKTHLEDLPTPSGSVDGHKDSQSSTTTHPATHRPVDKTSHPDRDKVAGETQTTDKDDGLATVPLVGIIVGVLLAIGFVGVIIIVVMRKVSGRFSP